MNRTRLFAALAVATGSLTIGVLQASPIVSAHHTTVECTSPGTITLTNSEASWAETFYTSAGHGGAILPGSSVDIAFTGTSLTVTGTWPKGPGPEDDVTVVNTWEGDCSIPVETTEPPVETTEPPVETTEPPVESTEPPVETTEPPTETTDPPVETTEPPIELSFDIDVEGTCSNTLTVTIGGGEADLFASGTVNGTPFAGPLGSYPAGVHSVPGELSDDVTIVLTIAATFEDGTVLSDTETVVADCGPTETTTPDSTTTTVPVETPVTLPSNPPLFENCDQVWDFIGFPGYGIWYLDTAGIEDLIGNLDADGDGAACERDFGVEPVVLAQTLPATL